MTKKRFIKLLMSHGVQRNKAHEIAGFYHFFKFPYLYAYKHFVFKQNITIKNFGVAFKRLAIQIQKTGVLCNELKEALTVLNKVEVKK